MIHLTEKMRYVIIHRASADYAWATLEHLIKDLVEAGP